LRVKTFHSHVNLCFASAFASTHYAYLLKDGQSRQTEFTWVLVVYAPRWP